MRLSSERAIPGTPRITVLTRVRAHPVLAFVLLAFAITWVAWWPLAAYNRGWTDVHLPGLYVLGGLGPGVAAYVIMRILRGRAGDAELLGPLLRWRVRWIWYAAAVLLTLGVWLLAATLGGTLSGELAALGTVTGVTMSLGLYLVLAVPEEVGWRGFALPMLQARHSALGASVIIGIVWFLWHLPLLLGGDPGMSTYPLLPYGTWFVAQSALYTWLYNNTRGSLLIAVLLHGGSNVVGVFSAAPWPATAITVALALIVVGVHGPRDLRRTGRRVSRLDASEAASTDIAREADTSRSVAAEAATQVRKEN